MACGDAGWDTSVLWFFMFSIDSVPRAPGARSAMAFAVLFTCAGAPAAFAADANAIVDQGGQVLTPVVVTAIRAVQPIQKAPVGATVITAQQIEQSGAIDANEAIRRIGGVAALSDLSNGREYGLDLRGFGAAADQNQVVLVDGIRLSENEMSSPRLSAIPVSQIERIEIVRGSNSVSWGEGAAGGVINIILKPGFKLGTHGRVALALESRQGHDAQVSVAQGWASVGVEAFARDVATDGFRENAAFRQKTQGLGLRWQHEGWRASLRAQQEDQEARMPGALSLEQYALDPRLTNTPDDASEATETLVAAQVSHQSGAWTVSTDLAYKERTSSDQYGGAFPYLSDKKRISRQVSPQVTHRQSWSGVDLVTTLGAQWQEWSFRDDNTYGAEDGRQINQAYHVRTDWSFPSQTRVTAGARKERVSKSAATEFSGYQRDNMLKAYEFGVSQTVADGWDVYGRVASSFRLPNLDENRYTPMSVALRPQRSRDQEIGLKWLKGPNSANVRYFRQKTVDEIAYVTSLFANTNIDPTTRQGLELDARWQVMPGWTVSGTWQAIQARTSGGVNRGKELVLTAPRTGTLRSTWRLNEHHTVDVGLQHLSPMRFGDDDDNSCMRRTPRSTLLDARYAWTADGWTVALSGANLTDQKGYNYAFSCSTGALYPEPGRLIRLSVARQF